MNPRGTSSAISIERSDDGLVITRRTYRPGDFAHYLLAIPGFAIGILLLSIGISRQTLFDSWATPVVSLGLIAYGWFALTTRVNRRMIRVVRQRLTARDHPIPSLARRIDVPLDAVGPISVRRVNRLTMPPTQVVPKYHVEAEAVPGCLMKNLPTKEEADTVRAGLVSFLAKT